jgi:hypothetical protein
MLLQAHYEAYAQRDERQGAEHGVGDDEMVGAVFDGDAAHGICGVDGDEGFFEGAGGLDASLDGESEGRGGADAGGVGWGAEGLRGEGRGETCCLVLLVFGS